MANWSVINILRSAYTDLIDLINNKFIDVARWFDSAATSPTNLPVGVKGWNNSASRFEEWNGTSWEILSDLYSINISGNAATATLASTAQSSNSCSGNAASATKLLTARTIGGVPFDGSANISLPGVNSTGNQNTSGSSASCSGNSATASRLLSGGSGTGMTFYWAGAPGTPTWVWGSNDGTNMYVYNTAGFSVNYATSANYANTSGAANGLTSSAWVSFNGITGAIYSSKNVTSVTRLGTGRYDVNFTGGAVTNSNYAVAGTMSGNYGARLCIAANDSTSAPLLKSTAGCRIHVNSSGADNRIDCAVVTVVFFGF